jgi:hypothetical protein
LSQDIQLGRLNSRHSISHTLARGPIRSPRTGAALSARDAALVRASFSLAAGLFDFVTIMIASLSTEALYHLWAYGWDGLYRVFGGAQESASNSYVCLFAATTFVVANATRKEYSFANYLQLRGHGWRCFRLWSLAILGAMAAGFLTQTSAEASRAALMLVYGVCFFAIYADRAALTHVVRLSARHGGVSARRLFRA